ncbi:molybdopterin molybdotransferase MoeA [Herbiconiux sp. CPCC 203407]|uniref:Molybdopterin molybdenumtransferase n=1 Tax=Herbiconiux oxytropis TaxID=2970915 RepID=A0AA41XFF3_9MICO|nr:molybdopterin molybdotransferase MoeA [Herbiconiux oxytropis]MCS5722379.1 molybdopterin molybdotransferase MoeA [Herbiconiux oxytropis]MCS5727224.1 molybdopterin molybdotransferase MoeA [Herbiconiux oxytropis]
MTAPAVNSPPTDWFEARRRAHRAGEAARTPTERVPLESALGRVLAQPLIALCDVPHAVTSAMDGWAVAGRGPWRLRELRAVRGSTETPALRHGEASPILTGGVPPAGADAVLRSELGVLSLGADGRTKLDTAPHAPAGEPAPGRHLRPAATEAARGETVLPAGCTLGPLHLALAAACGLDTVDVVVRPTAALVRTGDEVVDSGIPRPGQVRDSFTLTLPPLLAALGARVGNNEKAPDDLAATLAALRAAAGRASLVVTTGGTGRSGADHVRAALTALRAEVLVDGVAVRPGAPTLLARLPGGALVVALPGNPLAALLSLHTLAHPLLAGMQGLPLPTLGRVTVAEPIAPPGAPLSLRPYRLGPLGALPTAWHGSAMLRGLAEADGVLLVPADGAASGTQLDTLPAFR